MSFLSMNKGRTFPIWNGFYITNCPVLWYFEEKYFQARDDLESCKNCGRNFASDRIEKHEEICFKTSKKKRKTFDSTKKRVEGTDAATFVLNTKKGKAAASRSKAPSTQVRTPILRGCFLWVPTTV